MAKQPPKRLPVDDRSGPEPAQKKNKTQSEAEREAWRNWTYPPEFWDRLSILQLTRKAVAEHNRRICRQQQPWQRLLVPAPHKRAEQLAQSFPANSLARFARHGGPDLTDLRGHPRLTTHLTTDRLPLMAMSAGHSPRSEATKSTGPVATLPASETTRTKKSTPYNRDFDLHLSDHSIYPEYSSQEPDLEAIMAALAMPRLSLAPIHFTKDEFKAFRMADARTKDEDDVTANVLPTILGAHDPSQVSARNTVFRNIAPLTDGTIVAAAPDIYYGAHPEELCRPVRNALSAHIIPSTMQDKPLAPNFFVEVKGPNGTAAVATRQARYDGAVGARAMHSLQNYGEKELKYDNQVYTYSSIYHGGFGTLKLFAHHVTASANKGGQPEYHMTHVDTWALTGNVDSFRRGVTAFRNARDLAKQHRDRFIRAANALSKTIVPQNTETHQEAIDQGATDCPGPQDSKEPEPTANDNGHNDGHGNGHDNEHGNGHRIQDGTQTTASSQKPPRDPKELSQDSAAPTPSPAPSLTSAKTKPRLQTAEPVSPAVPDAPVEEDAAPQRPKTGRAAGQGKPGRARPKGTLRKEAGERDVPYGG